MGWNWMDWNWKIIIGAPGLLALLGHAWAWLNRRRDAGWREKLKGEVRQEVEQKLKEHEVRLQTGAELRLRKEAREWQLMQDLTGASWDAHRVVLDYAITVARHPGSAEAGKGYARANEALTKLFQLSATVPPQHEATAAVTLFAEAFNSANAFALPASPERPAVGGALVAIRRALDDGLREMHEIVARWNGSLWKDATTAPEPPGDPPAAGASPAPHRAQDG